MSHDEYQSIPIDPQEITPQHIYQTRRQFIKQMGGVGLGVLLASCAPCR